LGAIKVLKKLRQVLNDIQKVVEAAKGKALVKVII